MKSQIKFHSIIFIIFIIISLVINNNPEAQLLRRPQQGSFSGAKNQNYGQQIGIGNQLGLSSSLSNSKTVSQAQGGARNVAKSNSFTQGGNIGNLGISSTLTGTKSRTNGHLSGGGVGHDLNVGGLDLGSSLSLDNLKNIGLHRNSKGGAELGLGLLKLDVSKGAKPVAGGQTATNAGATGDRTRARANATAKKTNLGLFDLTSTNSQSQSFGASKTGQTSANAGGNAGTYAQPQRSPLLFGRRKRDLGKSHQLQPNYISKIERTKTLPCSSPKNCTGKQTEGRTFGLILNAMQGLFAPIPPVIAPVPIPIPHPPIIPHRPIYPPLKPCCYSCHQPLYSNCRFYPSSQRITSGLALGGLPYPSPGLYGSLNNGGLLSGYYGGGSFQAGSLNPLSQDQAAVSTANGNQNGQSSGTVLDIGPISYSSSTSNIGMTLLQFLFG